MSHGRRPSSGVPEPGRGGEGLLRGRLANFLLICCGVMCLGLLGPARAWVPPGWFILQRAEEQWKGVPGVVVTRAVTLATGEKLEEQVFLQAGRARLERAGEVRVCPEGADAPSSPLPPCELDAIFLRIGNGLADVAGLIGIEVETVTLARLSTPQAALPFRVLFRLGALTDGAPYLEIEKDRWLVRSLQLRERRGGPLWRAEYDRFGTVKELPGALPGLRRVYRDGVLVETGEVVRRLNIPLKESHFAAPAARKAGNAP